MDRLRTLAFDAVFQVVRLAVLVYFTIFHRLRVRGLHHLPRRGGFVVAPNHQSSLDGFLAGFRIRGRVHCAVERPYFRRPLVGWLLRSFRGLPLGGARDRRGWEGILAVLRRGHPVILFPEGRRTTDGSTLFKLQPGAARLALTVGVPIVPLALVGVWEVMPRGVHLPRPLRPIVVKVYPPIPCEVTEDRAEMKRRIEEINSRLETLYRRRLGAWKRLRARRR